jgi:N-acetylglucosaminyldiphosphoundecaprenol N-acetyl-beta-D-mannosaminyltransferase
MSGTVDILDVRIDKVDLVEAEELIGGFVRSGQAHQVVTVNLDFLSRAVQSPRFKELVNSSSLAVADGMPVVWASKFLNNPLPQRVTGMDLLHISSRLAREAGDPIFLLGAEPGVAQQAGEILCEQYSGLKVETYSPPFGEFSLEENAEMVRLINSSGAKHLFVAFGSPKQDYWISEHLSRLGVSVAVGIGGVFNYITGRVKRAPIWAQNLGLEWLFRLLQQPQLARRYFVDDLPVLLKIATHSSPDTSVLAAAEAEDATLVSSETGQDQRAA